MSILVCGGAGYIGSHTCVELMEAGYDIVVADNLYNSSEEAIRRVEKIVGKKIPFVKTELCDMEQVEALGADYTPVQDQATALLEVSSGTADAAVIDYLMAAATVREGTSYAGLTYTVELNSEEYGVGFRKGSDLVDAFNAFWKEAYDAGTVIQTATTYGVQESVIEK